MNPLQDYALGSGWALALGVGIYFWPISGRDRKALASVWAVKVLVTLAAMRFYERRYGVVDDYALDAARNISGWGGFSLGAGEENLWQLIWIHLRLGFNSVHALEVSFSMAGLIGVYLFYRAGVILCRCENLRAFYFLAIFPSILFWSSILGKDPLSLLAMAVYSYGVVSLQLSRGYRPLFPACLGIVAASYVRVWMGPIMIVPAILIMMKAVPRNSARIILLLGLFVFGALCARSLIASLSELREIRSMAIASFQNGNSTITAPEINAVKDVVRQLPAAEFTALFRPLPGDVPGVLGFLAGLENAALLLILAIALIRSRWADLRQPLVVWAVLLLAAWGAVYGLTVYNYGALVRYKLQILPLLLGLLLYLSHSRKASVDRR